MTFKDLAQKLRNTYMSLPSVVDTLSNGFADMVDAGDVDAGDVSFDNTGTSLSADNVEGAIKETLPIRGSLSNSSMTFNIPQNTVALVITSHPYDANACGAWIVCGGYTTTGAAVTPIKEATAISVTKTANQVVQISTEDNAFVTVVGLN